MPIYEYVCTRCAKLTELMQKMSDPAPEWCPHCRVGELKKLMSSSHVRFKGHGWYVTDYKKPEPPKKKED